MNSVYFLHANHVSRACHHGLRSERSMNSVMCISGELFAMISDLAEPLNIMFHQSSALISRVVHEKLVLIDFAEEVSWECLVYMLRNVSLLSFSIHPGVCLHDKLAVSNKRIFRFYFNFTEILKSMVNAGKVGKYCFSWRRIDFIYYKQLLSSGSVRIV